MINISKIEDLEYFIKNYNNEYIKNVVVELFWSLYNQSLEDKQKFNLENIIDGNGSITICENYNDKECFLSLFKDLNNDLSWCIKFKIAHNIEEFFQIGIIINNEYCEQYILPCELFDKSSIKKINQSVTCIKLLN